MSKGSTSTSTTTDPTQMAIYQDLYNRSKTIAGQPFVPFTGARVAGFNPDQLGGFNATRAMFNQSMAYNPMANINALANQPAQSLLDPYGGQANRIEAYQNPYNTQVIDQSLADLDRARQIRLQSDQDRAIGAGAFGGSRSGLLEAETNRNFADAAARTSSNLRQSGFNNAAQLAQNDMGRDFANRQFQSNLFSNQLGDQYKNLGLLSGMGGQQQQLQQRALDTSYNEFLRGLGYGPQQLGLLSQGVSALPTQTNTTQSQKTGMGDVLGTAANLYGMYLLGSDERMKKDIIFVGKQKGHNIYSWNWNNKAKSIGWDKYPTIGVLAQEVKKYMPEAVVKDENGYYKVNYGVL